ncbi:Integrin alpha-6 VLA-6 [Triplophysa tibetana]|uniref:Integrin alpha-6 VLA-6 n=1 Tax=Triplophysa tibetana TaxID=1572043 RepID=A0A5A9PJH4_9TELE|nr:Integrin alpha-6 VLA-6 [Triplophysa tibetana]
MFGFSLAMHRQLLPRDKHMLLVGAPKATALANQKSQFTGGMYSCDINSVSSSCQRVTFDNDEPSLMTTNKTNSLNSSSSTLLDLRRRAADRPYLQRPSPERLSGSGGVRDFF